MAEIKEKRKKKSQKNKNVKKRKFHKVKNQRKMAKRKTQIQIQIPTQVAKAIIISSLLNEIKTQNEKTAQDKEGDKNFEFYYDDEE